VQSNPVDGSSPTAVAIVHHPEVRRLLMRMRALTEAGRAMAAFTAGCQDLAHHGATDEARAQAKSMAEFLIPLVKGLCTENAVEVASLGVQVHGGMGFVEETGAAQHYRDARILPIYEGTTAIQANDFLGRKTLRDGGAMARKISGMIAQTEMELAQGSDVGQRIGRQLSQARAAFLEAVDHLLDLAKTDRNAAYGASVPYLMLAGTLIAGWQMAQSYLVAETALAHARTHGHAEGLAQDQDTEFMTAKIATARFHADHVLPETDLQRSRILDGADSLLAAVF
jgi:hypothetical protein